MSDTLTPGNTTTTDSITDAITNGCYNAKKHVLPNNDFENVSSGSDAVVTQTKKKKHGPSRQKKAAGPRNMSKKAGKTTKAPIISVSESESDHLPILVAGGNSSVTPVAPPKPVNCKAPAKVSFQKLEILYMHRDTLPSRASTTCAAEHVQFQKSTSLVYHFLQISNEILEEGDLIGCTLTCVFCSHKQVERSWVWSKKSGTGNYCGHFEHDHGAEWTKLVSLDEAVLGIEREEGDRSGDTLTPSIEAYLPLVSDST
jgi:hypothetical protein